MNLNPFAQMQRLGRALMLPIAVLPVAGLLLRLGQSDLLNIKMVANAGDAIFSNLPLLFAIGVAVGLARDNNGAAALAGAIGYLVEVAVMKTMNDKLDMGVLSGIFAGIVASTLYNRYKDIKLPEYLAFFGGKRFVPIVTGLACLLLGIVLGFIWQPVQNLINQAGQWLITAGVLGVFVFGVLNCLLRITGLHHILNSLVWFVFGTYTSPAGIVATGDLHRFFAGDPTAGGFMTGFFPVFMFGLPAACLAMYHEAPKDRRPMIAGLLFSIALTTFLTGVTEPVEFTFVFLAPALYAIHALLTGLSLAVCQALGIHLGFTFSAGVFDYILSFGLSTRGWWLLPLGMVYAVLYYGIFRFFIRWKNLPTPGREPLTADEASAKQASSGVSATAEGLTVKAGSESRAHNYIAALGGVANLTWVDACTTRLRLTVVDAGKVSESALKTAGARGLFKQGQTSVQVIIGPQADLIAEEIRGVLRETSVFVGKSGV